MGNILRMQGTTSFERCLKTPIQFVALGSKASPKCKWIILSYIPKRAPAEENSACRDKRTRPHVNKYTNKRNTPSSKQSAARLPQQSTPFQRRPSDTTMQGTTQTYTTLYKCRHETLLATKTANFPTTILVQCIAAAEKVTSHTHSGYDCGCATEGREKPTAEARPSPVLMHIAKLKMNLQGLTYVTFLS